MPIGEDFPMAPASPYGRSKLMIEQILQDLHQADLSWQIGLLRSDLHTNEVESNSRKA